MASISRPLDIGNQRAREATAAGGREIRTARVDRDLSLRAVARAVSLSESQVSRIERGLVRNVSVWDLARLHAVVGLELSVRSYPGGQPIRDAAHLALLNDLRSGLHRSLAWSTEVPLPRPGDQRSWDGLVRGLDWRYGVEAETAPRDVQALTRRVMAKVRDGHVDGVFLLVRPTVTTRAFLREGGDLLRASFPADGARALELLAAGVDPGGSAIVSIPTRRRSR